MGYPFYPLLYIYYGMLWLILGTACSLIRNLEFGNLLYIKVVEGRLLGEFRVEDSRLKVLCGKYWFINIFSRYIADDEGKLLWI